MVIKQISKTNKICGTRCQVPFTILISIGVALLIKFKLSFCLLWKCEIFPDYTLTTYTIGSVWFSMDSLLHTSMNNYISVMTEISGTCPCVEMRKVRDSLQSHWSSGHHNIPLRVLLKKRFFCMTWQQFDTFPSIFSVYDFRKILFLFQSGKAEDTIRQLKNELSMSKEKYSQVSHDVCIILYCNKRCCFLTIKLSLTKAKQILYT